jgi:hypothetical protein
MLSFSLSIYPFDGGSGHPIDKRVEANAAGVVAIDLRKLNASPPFVVEMQQGNRVFYHKAITATTPDGVLPCFRPGAKSLSADRKHEHDTRTERGRLVLGKIGLVVVVCAACREMRGRFFSYCRIDGEEKANSEAGGILSRIHDRQKRDTGRDPGGIFGKNRLFGRATRTSGNLRSPPKSES